MNTEGICPNKKCKSNDTTHEDSLEEHSHYRCNQCGAVWKPGSEKYKRVKDEVYTLTLMSGMWSVIGV